jgi:hypothetical protein
MVESFGESEAIILVEPSPRISKKNDITLCSIAATPAGKWVRLYQPLSKDSLPFRRWTHIKFTSKASVSDPRPESYDIEPECTRLIGELPQSIRYDFLSTLQANAMSGVLPENSGLKLVRPRRAQFSFEKKTQDEWIEEERLYEFIARRNSFPGVTKSQKCCPYKFKYIYSSDDGDHEMLCKDSSLDNAFFELCQNVGETKALMRMVLLFGKEYTGRGMIFIAGADPSSPDIWFINSIINMDEVLHTAGQYADVVA